MPAHSIEIPLDPEQLQRQFARPGAITFSTLYGGPVARLAHGGSNAIVALQGAQVISYTADGLGELLWLSPQAKLGTGKAVRGGIPVCWPWFGPHPENTSHPAHGLVRARPWRVVETSADAEGTQITLALTAADCADALWPPVSAVSLQVRLTQSLEVVLTTQNHGQIPLTLTQALHSYFKIGDIDAIHIGGLEDIPYIDQLEPGSLKNESSEVRVCGEIDRIYQGPTSHIALSDAALGRRLLIRSQGSASAVVWNPWIEKSARLGDLGEDGYRGMVCIETANAGDDRVALDPGDKHALCMNLMGEHL